MRRYQFRLESVLRARRAQEQLARQDLARANAVLRRAEVHYRQECERYESFEPGVRVEDRESFNRSRALAELTAATLAFSRKTCEDAAVAAAVRHAAWREAAQRVASLERLEDRRREEHSKEAARAEAAEIDDVVTSRWAAEDVRLQAPPGAVEVGR